MAGGFAGGLAQGLGAGVGLRQKIDDQREERDEKNAQKQYDAAVKGLALPGSEVAGDYSSDKAVAALLEANKPKPGLVQRIGTAVTKGLRPKEAAQAAGVTPPPVPVQEAGAGLAPAQPAPTAAPTAVPQTEVDELTVQAAGPRKKTDLEYAREMLALSHNLKGEDAMARREAAFARVHELEGKQLVKDITVASFGGVDRLTNTLSKTLGMDFEAIPVEGKQGVYRVSINGEDAGEEMTLDQMRDRAAGLAMQDPRYPLTAGIARSQDARADKRMELDEREAAATTAFRRAQLGIQQRELELKQQNSQVANEQTQLEIETLKQPLEYGKSLTNLISNGDGVSGDIGANWAKVQAMAQAAPKAYLTSRVITDAEGVQKPTVINLAMEQAKAAKEAWDERWNSSPYTKNGGITLTSNPKYGDRQFYVVKGVNDGVFTSFDAAEAAARRLQKPPAKKK